MPAYTSPKQAEEGLTDAFKPTTPEQEMAIANAASLVPKTHTMIGQTDNPITPTVLTGANISENKIPELDKKANKLSETGAVLGPDGITRYADGTMVPQEDPELGSKRQQGGTYTGQDGQFYYNYDSTPVKSDSTQEGIFTNMKMAADAQTKKKLDSIEQNYSLKKSLQEESNNSVLAGFRSSLLANGNARYAPKSAEGLVTAEQKALQTSIQSINAEEQSLIADALQAQQDKDYEILGKKLDLLETRRQEKQKIADQLNESVAKDAQTLSYENQIEEAINGGAKTAQDVFKALAGKVPIANIKEAFDAWGQGVADMKTQIGNVLTAARNNGAPPDVINKILSATSMADAVNAAGDYGSGGTGIVGEYNFYKAQAKQLGQEPVDFNTYQNMDANRKAKIAASANGLNPTTLTKVQQIANGFDNEQVIKDYNTISQQIGAVESAGTTPTDDIQRIYAFAKVMDPNSVVREGEYSTVQAYSTALLQRYGLQANRIWNNDGFLTDEARGFLLKTLKNRLSVTDKSYDNVASEYARRINKITGASDGSDYITNYKGGYTPIGNDIIQTEDQAKDTVIQYGKTNPDVQSHIIDLVTKPVPELGRPATYDEVINILGIPNNTK